MRHQHVIISSQYFLTDLNSGSDLFPASMTFITNAAWRIDEKPFLSFVLFNVTIICFVEAASENTVNSLMSSTVVLPMIYKLLSWTQ